MSRPKSDPWPLGRPVEIEWRDASSYGGWGAIEDYRQRETAHCRTVGYVVNVTKDNISLAQTQTKVMEHGPTPGVTDVIVIPKPWIVRGRRKR